MTKPRRQYGRIMRMVEEEYGQPFWDVVAGFGADGSAINRASLERWIERYYERKAK